MVTTILLSVEIDNDGRKIFKKGVECMRVFLTGSNGMVGRNILEHPKAAGYDWLTPSRADLDLCSDDEVRSYVFSEMPDMIIHAAGKVGGIQANIREPVDFLISNLKMGCNLIMAARDAGIPRLLNLGSSCMYPKDEVENLREDQVLSGQLEPTNEGYAIAKSAVAKLCSYINAEAKGILSYKTLIPSNLFGRWDKFDPKHSHMIPAVIRKIHQAHIQGNDVVEIWGDGTAFREFMYCGDFADCVIRCLEPDLYYNLPSMMNVGCAKDYTVNQYYKAVAEVVGFRGSFVHDVKKPVGMRRKKVDTSLLKKWGWSPMHNLTEGLRQTYDFFLEYANEEGQGVSS